MKLLIIQPMGDKFGHFGLHVSKLAQELALRGHEVTICTNRLDVLRFVRSPIFDVFEVNNGSLAFEEIDRQAKSRPLRYWFGYFRNSWVITRAATRLLRAKKFDGIYLTDVEFSMASLALKCQVGFKVPLVMQVNASNFSFSEYPGGFLKKLYKVIQREVLRLAVGREVSAFSVLGEWHKPRLVEQLRLPRKFPVVLIPDGGGVDLKPIPREVARHALGISWSGDIFLFMGILRRDKGLEELSLAIRNLWVKRKDFRVVLAGAPFEYHRHEIEKMFRLESLDSPIIHMHLDYVSEDELPNYFYSADSLLLPYNTKYKGSSGPLMKGACTFGLPVVVSDVSEMGRLTKAHQLGFISEPGDASSLEAAMNSFLDTPHDKRREFKRRALSLGNKNTWPEMARKYEVLFEKLSSEVET